MRNRNSKSILVLVGLVLLTACGVADTANSNIAETTIMGTTATAIVSTTGNYPAPLSSTTISIPTVPDQTATPIAQVLPAYPRPSESTPGPIQTPDSSVPLDPIAMATQIAEIKQRVPLNRNDAVELAIIFARERGLKKSRPDQVVIRQMTFGEYGKLTGFESGPNAAQFGLEPTQLVWVVTIFGEGRWTGPGGTGTDEDKFDHVNIVLNVESGRFMASGGPPLSLDGSLPEQVLASPEPTAPMYSTNNPILQAP